MTRGICAAIAAFLLFPAVAAAQREGGRTLDFRWPADGVVTSPYGQDGARWHPGIDIGILRSLDVRAAASGLVTQIGFVRGFDGYGSVVVLDHGDGFSTLYAHLSKPLVRVGDYVGQGELIGEAGCSGWCTGTHLHFELRYRNVAIDPSFLILG
jgi:murein DD-endopeptidase MepM/ murein hydrolase activator NlpD